jgi:hypothetical protein
VITESAIIGDEEREGDDEDSVSFVENDNGESSAARDISAFLFAEQGETPSADASSVVDSEAVEVVMVAAVVAVGVAMVVWASGELVVNKTCGPIDGVTFLAAAAAACCCNRSRSAFDSSADISLIGGNFDKPSNKKGLNITNKRLV